MNLHRHAIITQGHGSHRGSLGAAYSSGLDKHAMFHGDHGTFAALTVLCAPPAHLSFPQPDHGSFYRPHSSALFRTPKSWDHAEWHRQVGLLYLVICIRNSSVSSHGLTAHFFLALSNIPMSAWTSLPIHHPWKDILVASKV